MESGWVLVAKAEVIAGREIPLLVSPLQFITLMNNNSELLALIDSGAQLNLISQELLRNLTFNSIEGTVSRLRGVDNSVVKIVDWVLITMHLSNRMAVNVPFAVVNGIKSGVILGLPFLKQLRAKVDPANRIIEFPQGPLMLMEQPGRNQSFNVNVVQIDIDLVSQICEKAKVSLKGKDHLKKLLQKYIQLYFKDKRGLVKGLTHVIRLTTSRPIVTRPRVHTVEHEKAINEEVEKMLQDGVIVPSNSPHSSEIVMVKKKTGEWRMCIDYRPLNNYTINDKYQLPRISDLLYSVKGSKYFIAIDLRSGYWQIPMELESRSYTAFRAGNGLYEFQVMPFGLKTAPATFQRNMDFLLGDLKFKNVSVYIDDILIHHQDESECLLLLEMVLDRLSRAGMTINLKKSEFFPESLKYLGHVISEGTLKPDGKKVEALHQLSVPKNVSEVRSLLGMIGYFQSFIPNYSQVAAPITDLLKGHVNKKRVNQKTVIQWNQQCDASLQHLVTALKDATLNVPPDDAEFVVQTDASDRAIGGVLLWKKGDQLCPVYFVSKKLSGPQLRWAIREKEAFAIIHCLQKFDRFIRPTPFTVLTDNQSLKWLFDAKVGKLARWAIIMSEYNMTIKWIKGSTNVVADHLSRYTDEPDPVQDRMVYAVTVEDSLPSIKEILLAQKQTTTPMSRGYISKSSVIYYRGGLWVPEIYRQRIIAACHLLPPLNHPGVKRTKRIILRAFNWPDLHTDVTEYIKSCLVCQRLRPAYPFARLHPHDPLNGILSVLHIDFWHCTFRGVAYEVLTMIDSFSRWPEATVVTSKDSKTVASTIVCKWICRFGVPRRLVSDNEPSFVSAIIKNFAGILGIQRINTIPYRPQGNSPIEAFHKQLNKSFNTMMSFRDLGIDEVLQLALFSYRATIHSTLLESPAFMLYGLDPLPPQDCDWRFISDREHRERIEFLSQVRNDILERALQLRQFAIENHNESGIKVGDLVITRANPNDVYQHAVRTHTAVKLVPKWSLPCRVVNVSRNDTRIIVQFLLSGTTRLVHISDIKRISLPRDANQRRIWAEHFAKRVSEDKDKKRKRSIEELLLSPLDQPQKIRKD